MHVIARVMEATDCVSAKPQEPPQKITRAATVIAICSIHLVMRSVAMQSSRGLRCSCRLSVPGRCFVASDVRGVSKHLFHFADMLHFEVDVIAGIFLHH